MKKPNFFLEFPDTEKFQESSGFEKLPDELILDIFQKAAESNNPQSVIEELQRIAGVNRNFYRLANDPQLRLYKLRQQQQQSKLKDAVMVGNISRVKELIGQGLANLNHIYKTGWSLLHSVASLGPKKSFTCTIAELLINSGANVNIKGKGGDTPLHKAAEIFHVEMAKLLIEKAADVNAENEKKEKPADRARDEIFKNAIDTNSNWQAVVIFFQEQQRREEKEMQSIMYDYPGGSPQW